MDLYGLLQLYLYFLPFTIQPLQLRTSRYITKESINLKNTKPYRHKFVQGEELKPRYQYSIEHPVCFFYHIHIMKAGWDFHYAICCAIWFFLLYILNRKSRGKFTLWQHDSSPILVNQLQEAVDKQTDFYISVRFHAKYWHIRATSPDNYTNQRRVLSSGI
jgi:hypothetical protein